jgi:hypothetical protein
VSERSSIMTPREATRFASMTWHIGTTKTAPGPLASINPKALAPFQRCSTSMAAPGRGAAIPITSGVTRRSRQAVWLWPPSPPVRPQNILIEGHELWAVWRESIGFEREAAKRYAVAIPHANRFATPAALTAMALKNFPGGSRGFWYMEHVCS